MLPDSSGADRDSVSGWLLAGPRWIRKKEGALGSFTSGLALALEGGMGIGRENQTRVEIGTGQAEGVAYAVVDSKVANR